MAFLNYLIISKASKVIVVPFEELFFNPVHSTFIVCVPEVNPYNENATLWSLALALYKST